MAIELVRKTLSPGKGGEFSNSSSATYSSVSSGGSSNTGSMELRINGGSAATYNELKFQNLGVNKFGLYHNVASNNLRVFSYGSANNDIAVAEQTGAWTIGPTSGSTGLTHQVVSGSGAVELKVFSSNPGSSAATLSIRNSSGTASNDGVKFVYGGGVLKFRDLADVTVISLDMTSGGTWTFSPSGASRLSVSSTVVSATYDTSNFSVQLSNTNGSGRCLLVAPVGGANDANAQIQRNTIPYSVASGHTDKNWIAFEDPGAYRGGIRPNGSGLVNYASSSDSRLKTEITDFKNGLDIVMAMKPRHFKWVASGIQDMGFIAQELQDVYPGAVSEGDDREGGERFCPWSVDYGKITPALTSAIQQLAKENAILRTRIEALEGKPKSSGGKRGSKRSASESNSAS